MSLIEKFSKLESGYFYGYGKIFKNGSKCGSLVPDNQAVKLLCVLLK